MKEINIACVSTYLPRKCGIATFSNNLLNSIINNDETDIDKCAYVVALNKNKEDHNYSGRVKLTVRQNNQLDYIKAAKYINYSNANICLLQHEFGIFGGQSGTYILSLTSHLKIPLLAVFHTILKEPTYTQKAIIQKISNQANKVVVMSKLGAKFLNTIYDIPLDKILRIEHGVPDFQFIENKKTKSKYNLEGKKVLLTFGLLNRNKGIETVIKSLVEVVKKHKDIVYIILGNTHPNVVKESGEEYRSYLHGLVQKYSLQNYVYFHDQFVSDNELFNYLSATDIYITPYLNKAQMTSGSLSYAVGAGAAVISTPYWHAKELLAKGRGILFKFGDYQELSKILTHLLDNPDELKALRKKAYDYGRKHIWAKVGQKYLEQIINILNSSKKVKSDFNQVIDPLAMPPFTLKHVERLTYKTGIVQHALYNIPNLKKGFCIDDNSRALLMTVMACNQLKDPKALELLPNYLSFINYMQNDDGTFRNFLSFNGEYLDEKGSEDSFGRTIWGLGYLLRYSPNTGYLQLSFEIFSKALPNFLKLKEVRSIAFTINGIYHYLKRYPSDEKMMKLLKVLTNKIISRIDKSKDSDWPWFENILTYSNGIVPLALFYSYKLLKNKKTLKSAKKLLKFLEKIKFRNNYLSVIGNNGWYKKGNKPSHFAQQPINATSMVLLFNQAYKVTKDKDYLKKMFTSYLWFLGKNELEIPLYNFDTGGCSDGLESYGVNKNQGAESTLAYLIAHLKVLHTLEKDIAIV